MSFCLNEQDFVRLRDSQGQNAKCRIIERRNVIEIASTPFGYQLSGFSEHDTIGRIYPLFVIDRDYWNYY